MCSISVFSQVTTSLMVVLEERNFRLTGGHELCIDQVARRIAM